MARMKEGEVSRVTFTPSVVTMCMDPDKSLDVVMYEPCRSDLEFCKSTKHFCLSLEDCASAAAWKMAKGMEQRAFGEGS